MRKTKIKIPHPCPYRYNECTMPEGERCPCSCDSIDPVEWKRKISLCASCCRYIGHEMSNVGWRGKYLMLTDEEIKKRQEA